MKALKRMFPLLLVLVLTLGLFPMGALAVGDGTVPADKIGCLIIFDFCPRCRLRGRKQQCGKKDVRIHQNPHASGPSVPHFVYKSLDVFFAVDR